MKSWVASLALHGAAAGLAALVWLEPEADAAPDALRWEVAFITVPVAEPAPAAAAARPQPARPAPPAEPVRAVQPAPPPPPRPALEALPEPVQAVAPAPPAEAPVPALSQPVTPPPALAEAPAVARPTPLAAARTDPPVATGDSAAEVERRWYLALLERLRAMKRYPMAARRLGQEGVVLIEARIGEDGRLQASAIKRGSGYPLLDRDALRLLEAAAADARGELQPERPTRLEIPIAYRLES